MSAGDNETSFLGQGIQGGGSFLGGGGLTQWSAAAPAPQAGEGLAFEIKGHELQFLEAELRPGEAMIAEAGQMMFKDAAVSMETIFGDGSEPQNTGFFGKLLGGAKRVLSGATLFMTRFANVSGGPARVAFSAPYPGKILALRLDRYGGELFCQRETFLAAAQGVKIDVAFQKKIMTGLFGGEGFIMQRLAGQDWVFVHAGGMVVERELAPGEEIHVDAGCLVAQTATVDFDVVPVGGIKSMIFGGEGFFFARLIGPGHVWLQSMPVSRLAGQILSRAPAHAEVGVGHSWGGGSGGSSGDSSSFGSWGDSSGSGGDDA
ncbi:AIM24 family protein [Methylocystis iwaonis]|uniref:AIM24 family protein n=1 Tax=Methylocystis iwaonis TaxID=2885079 RepID=UPI002E7C4DEF|nr:AIM24 family protein [Methylocystis iwaonis]